MEKNETKERTLSRREALEWVARAAVVGCLAVHTCDVFAEEKAGGAKGLNLKDLKDIGGGSAASGSGYVVVKTDKGVAAFSDVCTHRGKNIKVDGTKGIFCPAHGSQFNADGSVKKGPAKEGLSWLKLTLDKDGNVSVDTKSTIKDGTWTPLPDAKK
ncbi:MAG: Rieske (2Fe-2S) protein [Planctomycetes bacterium]|nr:Rieske (2Fe-2S) protein [Planctomycetota bacterium]